MRRRSQPELWNAPVNLGPGFKEFANAVAKKLDEEHEQREQREREAAAQHAYEGQGVYYLMVRRRPSGIVRVESIEPFPFAGRLWANGRNLEVAITNLRLKWAEALYEQQLLCDWDECRRYAIEHSEFRYDLTGAD